ncbi:MAG: MCP four helix bundle domain-containing protein [Burkholderiales bacterium]|nr:MCP four helix bundle domain-containing protein [Burkholderiales bacterium]
MVMFNQLRGRLAGLPVSLQLYGAFAFLLLLTGVVGALSLTALSRVDQAAETLSSKWLTGVGHLAQTRAAMVDTREFEIKHSRTSDRSYHAEYEDKIEEASRSANEALAAYAALAAPGQERELYDQLARSWAGYGQTQAQIVKLGRDQQQQDAADISDGAGSMGIDDTLGALSRTTTTSPRAAWARDDYRQSRWGWRVCRGRRDLFDHRLARGDRPDGHLPLGLPRRAQCTGAGTRSRRDQR